MTSFHLAAAVALATVVVLLFLVLFEPGLPYRVVPPDVPLDSHLFLGLMAAVVDAQLLGRSRIEILTDGKTFY